MTDPHPSPLPRGRGIRRSSALTNHRRLWLIRRMVRGPATPAELIADARRFFDEEIYPASAATALRHDFDALRDQFECVIERDREGRYALVDYGRLALLDLPDADLETLSFLVSLFAEGPTPNAPQVQALFDRILALLPPDRRKVYATSGPHLRMDTPQQGSSPSNEILEQIRRNLGRQYLSFLYRSTFSAENVIESHRVAPYRLFMRDGHTYLEAVCHASPYREIERRYVPYRVDRIVDGSLKVEPTRLPPGEPPRRSHPLRYLLAPQVALRRDIAIWFPRSAVTFLPDGSAEISAEVSDLWQARQILLRYREHCTVLEPAELVQMMRESVTLLQERYS
jgi:predicted DNA-binding transcriptional regulator YafY